MDMAIACKKFGPTALRQINYCRLYLNVILLSDITDPTGTCIEDAAYAGDKDALYTDQTTDSVHQA